ncbi:MAG: sugar ABC transporter permease, partial [Clostridia bacterium]|nr:sugar ABC transporter permease [Clostridia bacterium]
MAQYKKIGGDLVANTSWRTAIKRDWQLYLLLIFPIVIVIMFNYAAYPGLRMIFMDYKPVKGYAGSD